MKARKRNKALSKDPTSDKIIKAKAADQAIVIYAKRKVMSSAEYMSILPEKQKEIIKNSTKTVRLKRYFLTFFILIFILIWL